MYSCKERSIELSQSTPQRPEDEAEEDDGTEEGEGSAQRLRPSPQWHHSHHHQQQHHQQQRAPSAAELQAAAFMAQVEDGGDGDEADDDDDDDEVVVMGVEGGGGGLHVAKMVARCEAADTHSVRRSLEAGRRRRTVECASPARGGEPSGLNAAEDHNWAFPPVLQGWQEMDRRTSVAHGGAGAQVGGTPLERCSRGRPALGKKASSGGYSELGDERANEQ